MAAVSPIPAISITSQAITEATRFSSPTIKTCAGQSPTCYADNGRLNRSQAV